MCLGIPGLVVEVDADHPEMATIDVLGEKRRVNTSLIAEGVAPGDWVLIHVGFAMQKLSRAEAESAMQGLEMMRGPASGFGDGFDEAGDEWGDGFDEPPGKTTEWAS